MRGASCAVLRAGRSLPGPRRHRRTPGSTPGKPAVGDRAPDEARRETGRQAAATLGGLGIGDPARDLTIAFTLMTARSRDAFRAALGVDDATWMRGRGWALATGLNAYPSYAGVDPRIAARTTRQITEALIGR